MGGAITLGFPAPAYLDPDRRTVFEVVSDITPVANRAYLLAVTNGGADGAAAALPSLIQATTGQTFTLAPGATGAHSSDPNRRLSIYLAPGVASPTLGDITVTFPTAQGYCSARLIALAGVDHITPTVQVLFRSSGETKTGSYSPPGLAGWSDPNGALVAIYATSNQVHLNVGADTLVAEQQLASGKNTTLAVAFHDGEQTSPSVTVRTADDTAASTTKVLAVLIELRPATASTPAVRPKATPVWTLPYSSSAASASYTNVGDVTTPVAGDVYLLGLMSGLNSGTPNDPIVTGYGLTWELVEEVHWSNTPIRNLWVYRACEASGLVAGRLTVNFSGQTQTSLLAVLLHVEDTANATGDEGASAIVQVTPAFHDSTNVSTYEITLDDPFEPGDTNVAVAFFGAAITGSMSPATSPAPTWDELGDTTTVTAGKNATMAAYWFDGKDTSAKVNLSTAGKVAGIIIEVRGVAGAVTGDAGVETISLADGGIGFSALDDELIALVEDARFDESGGLPDLGAIGPIPEFPAPVILLVQARDANLSIVCEVEQYDELEIVPRFQATGRWRMVVPVDPPLVPEAAAAHRKAIAALAADGAGIVVKRNGIVEFSGVVREKGFTFSGGRESMVLAGPDDSVILDDRVAHPEPLTEIPPFDHQAYDVRQGQGETVIYQYTLVNVGPAALERRKLARLQLAADKGRGANANPEGGPIIGRARYQTLADVIRAVAALTENGLGWDVLWSSDGVLTFEVYEPVDRSDTVVFSREFGNLAAYDLQIIAPTATTIYVGGQGEETERAIVEITDPAGTAEWGRIERFADRRDVPSLDTAGLQQAAEQALVEARGKTTLMLRPVDLPRQSYRRHYRVGDLVKVVIAGVAYVAPVREVSLRYSSAQGQPFETITPAIGDQPVPTQLFDRIARLEAGQSTLQRR